MIVLIGPIGLIGNHCLKERTFSDGYHKEMNTGIGYQMMFSHGYPSLNEDVTNGNHGADAITTGRRGCPGCPGKPMLGSPTGGIGTDLMPEVGLGSACG